MSFYSLDYQSMLKLPLRTFWLLSKSINRIEAERGLRSLSIAQASQSSEGFKAAYKRLEEEVGEAASEQTPEPVGTEQMAGLMRRLKVKG